MLNDLTGGPGYPAIWVVSNSILFIRLCYYTSKVNKKRMMVRGELLKTSPDGRLNIDGITYQ